MADTAMLQVEIVTPEQSAFSGAASEVLIPAWEGEMGILPEHDAILALLRSGRCSVVTPDGVQEFVIGRGFAEVGPDRVTILTEACDRKGTIDVDAAQKDLDEARAFLEEATDVFSEAYKQAQLAEEHAQARLGLR